MIKGYCTVKASNVGPHVSYGLLFLEGLHITKTHPTYRKIEKMKVVAILQIFKVGFLHFWYKIQPKKLLMLQEKLQRFPEVQS